MFLYFFSYGVLMNVDYSKPHYITVPEDYVAPAPRPSQCASIDTLAVPLIDEQYISSPDDEFLGPKGLGKRFPRDLE